MKGLLGQLSFSKTSPSAPLCTGSGKQYEQSWHMATELKQLHYKMQ